MISEKVLITCNQCKQPVKAIKQWNYKFKEFIYTWEYCWGCYNKQYVNGYKKF